MTLPTWLVIVAVPFVVAGVVSAIRGARHLYELYRESVGG